MSRPIYAPVPTNHTAGACLSATTEAGLTTTRPVASTNAGSLVLRAHGTPSQAGGMDVRLQTGGRAAGWAPYVSGGAVGAGALGAAALWKFAADATSAWRGYEEPIYLTSLEFPVTYSSTNGPPGTPRTLGNGSLGWVQPTNSTARFYTINEAGTVASVQIDTTGPATDSTSRSDCVVFPNGRIVAILKQNANNIRCWSSSDHGATWTFIGTSSVAGAGLALNAELVGDVIVLVHGSETAAADTNIYVSNDGGCSFTWATATGGAHYNVRTCVIDGKILVSTRNASNVGLVYSLTPGSDLSGSVTAGTLYGNVHCIGARDDGTIWFYRWETAAAATLSMKVYVSTDGGLTFTDAAGVAILDLETTGYGSTGYDQMAVGCWRGEMILLARVASASGSDAAIHLMRWGGYSTVTEGRTQKAYEHGYSPVDYPQNVGWTKTDVAAGATVTNQGPLNIVSTAANNSWWRTSANLWTSAAGDTKMVRFRVRVNSGGGVADDRSYVRLSMDDGANQQAVTLRFSTTTCRVIRDDTGATLVDITDDFTAYTEFWLVFKHDNGAGTARLLVLHRQDADRGIWTEDLDNATIGEVAGTNDRMEFGGSAVGAANWDVAFIQICDEVSAAFDMFTFDNPDDLVGRPLNSTHPIRIAFQVGLTGANAGGISGDTYDLDTAYDYGVASVWANIRPSCHLRSTSDATAWAAVFDAGSKGVFTAGVIALFGTNFMEATVELNAADSWATPSFSVTLSAVVWQGAGLASGEGFCRVSGAQWVPHEFRSDGDGHRWFARIDTALGANLSYEITDNDTDTLYVNGIDLSTVSGTVYVYGDRMGRVIDDDATPPRYRYARVKCDEKATVDDYYTIGTLVLAPRNDVDRGYDLGYVDRVTPAVEVTELDSGYRTSVRTGPRRWELAVQWAPVNGMQHTAPRAVQAIYEACDGPHRPLVFWRDPSDVRTLYLCRIQEQFSSQGLRGEGTTAVRQVNQLVLSEEL